MPSEAKCPMSGANHPHTLSAAQSNADWWPQQLQVGMLHQHALSDPIGVWQDVREDPIGLFVRGRIIEQSPAARLAGALVRAGALDGLSIGYVARAARSDPAGDGRILTEIDLFEVSLVSFPMLPGARLTVIRPTPDLRRVA